MSETPFSPEDDGIPDYANDDSSAYDEGTRPLFDDSPAALPGTDLDELPPVDIGPEEEADLNELPRSNDVASADHETWVDSQSGIGVTESEGDVAVEVGPVDVQPVNTNVDVPPPDVRGEDADITLDDVNQPGYPVGRLVDSTSAPVDPTPTTTDDVTAFDTHETEGLSPEESAMHVVDDPDATIAD
jgi:uncharacterized protein DUF5709